MTLLALKVDSSICSFQYEEFNYTVSKDFDLIVILLTEKQ